MEKEIEELILEIKNCCKSMSDETSEVLLRLFFKDKVIIQKGENRHPDADVLHQWAEGINIQTKHIAQSFWGNMNPWTHYLFRIKPSEPAPEYQYLRIDGDSAYPTEDFLTEEEAKALGLKIRLENTKRPRE